MKIKFKNAFDKIIPSDYKKKYFYKNGEEELVFFKQGFSIVFSYYLNEKRNHIIEVVIDNGIEKKNLMKTGFLDQKYLIEYNVARDNFDLDQQLIFITRIIEENKNKIFEHCN